MRLKDLEKVQALRDILNCTMQAFDEVAQSPHNRFPLKSPYGSRGVIAELSGSDVLPILGRKAAGLVVELTDLGVDMSEATSPHLTPYLMAIRHPKPETKTETASADSGEAQS
ncbi:hypothetical protein CFR73_12880 [Novacetimonas maltaceti]|uniref:Uncharacterized protein n=1 Tax=Novacetimonas maltaceti TaxID=1203393 RepID=A0A2S3W006_9PROT|nr:hypothetical protein [Novacetimonas maltaceti]POF62186.1 hypothetical protein KMAL_22000 [Novacetimonas maltaceti]PYD59218.1 hypothetical protein CFR73_12880 [Novacetimonas maltaceti]BCZ75942.1 hypothetical protein [Komagataeibacter phage phiKM1]